MENRTLIQSKIYLLISLSVNSIEISTVVCVKHRVLFCIRRHVNSNKAVQQWC